MNVCIATYKRPQLLKRLLLSLISQETNGEFCFTIIVADNDAHRSADTVVQEFNRNGQNIIYDVEPEQNIALARNKSLSHSDGDYIVTIDDDLYADRQWLLNLFRATSCYGADVVNGPVIKTFLPKTPNYIMNSDEFNRPNPVTGSSGIHVPATGNALFRRSSIKDVPEPFDPSFGKTGGEDTVFFNLLKERGCRIIWCREAIVYGPVPPERANLLWILKRRFRYGYLRHRIFTVPDSVKRVEIRSSFQALVTLIGRVLLYTIGSLLHRRYYGKGMKCLLAIAYHIGILACYANIRYEEYGAK